MTKYFESGLFKPCGSAQSAVALPHIERPTKPDRPIPRQSKAAHFPLAHQNKFLSPNRMSCIESTAYLSRRTTRRGASTMTRAAFILACYRSRIRWKAVAQVYCQFRKETCGACRSCGRMGKCITLGNLLPRRRPPNGSPITGGGRYIKLSRPRMVANETMATFQASSSTTDQGGGSGERA